MRCSALRAGSGYRVPSAIVDFATMTDSRDFNQPFSVVDSVDDTVIAYADAPLAISSVEFLTARRPGMDDNISKRRTIRETIAAGSFLSSRAAVEVGTTR